MFDIYYKYNGEKVSMHLRMLTEGILADILKNIIDVGG